MWSIGVFGANLTRNRDPYYSLLFQTGWVSAQIVFVVNFGILVTYNPTKMHLTFLEWFYLLNFLLFFSFATFIQVLPLHPIAQRNRKYFKNVFVEI